MSGRADERVAEARFNHAAASGSVYFRFVGSHVRGASPAMPAMPDEQDGVDALILTDLRRAPPPNATRSKEAADQAVVDHDWRIYVTDILDSESGMCCLEMLG